MTFSAHLTEVRRGVLYEAVSFFLLVRQQVQRIDQICAQVMISCTMLVFSASSCATKSNASLILSKTHSEAFTFS